MSCCPPVLLFINEKKNVQPAFLRGQTRQSRELSPVRIVANPDGSMQRSALQQVQMAKERRELRQAQANQLIDNMPKDLNRPWEDPMPDAGERLFTQELRGISVSGCVYLCTSSLPLCKRVLLSHFFSLLHFLAFFSGKNMYIFLHVSNRCRVLVARPNN